MSLTIQKQTFYQPVPRGLEIKIQEKLAQLRALDQSVARYGLVNPGKCL